MLAVVSLLALSACNECDFRERCNGDTHETCGGIDQIIGRDIIAEPCLAPNGTCVQVGNEAACVVAPLTPCGAERCEGSVSYSCVLGHEQALDCAALRQSDGSPGRLICAVQNGSAYCRLP